MTKITVYQVVYIPDNPTTQHVYPYPTLFLFLNEALRAARGTKERHSDTTVEGKFGLIERELTFVEV